METYLSIKYNVAGGLIHGPECKQPRVAKRGLVANSQGGQPAAAKNKKQKQKI